MEASVGRRSFPCVRPLDEIRIIVNRIDGALEQHRGKKDGEKESRIESPLNRSASATAKSTGRTDAGHVWGAASSMIALQ
jgi:hypothetical protein